MKQISENYNSYMFYGDETTQEEFRGHKVKPDFWYIGDDGFNIEAGPFATESQARSTFCLMIDTSGT